VEGAEAKSPQRATWVKPGSRLNQDCRAWLLITGGGWVHSQALPVAAALQYNLLQERHGPPGVLGTLGWWVRSPLLAYTSQGSFLRVKSTSESMLHMSICIRSCSSRLLKP
jgi:hypothetical protein